MARKLTYEEVKHYIEVESDSGCKLISRGYKNARSKLEFRCSCGGEFERTLSDFKTKTKKCYSCTGHKRYDFKEVYELIEKEGCTLLNKSYPGFKHLMDILCSCGDKFKTTFERFRVGKTSCDKCSNFYRYSYLDVKEYVENNSNCKLLSTDYKNYSTSMDFLCSCGQVFQTTFQRFKNGKQQCNDCSGVTRYSYDDVRAFVESDSECVLLSKNYENFHSKMLFKCACGETFETSFYYFKTGKRRCNSCNGSFRFTFKDIQEYVKENSESILKSTSYTNNSQKLDFICSCGEPFSTSFANFKNGKVTCDKCRYDKVRIKFAYSYDEVKKKFEEKGFTLLTDTYFNNIQPLEYVCSCGRNAVTNVRNLNNLQGCRICSYDKISDQQRFEFSYVKSVFEKRDCKLLSTEYINSSSNLMFICSCGNKATTNFERFKNGALCRKCGYAKGSEKQKLSYDYIKGYFESQNCTLLSTEYENAHGTLEYICSCGNKATTIWTIFHRGSRCRECGIKKNSGNNHYLYNENLTEEERVKGRKLLFAELVKWRNEVFSRDSYTCQACGDKGITLNAHHLDGYNWCEEKRTDVNNGVTLCGERNNCHADFHKQYGYGNNTRQQFEEWLETNKRKPT